jgi:hypothetical protein
MIVVTYLVNLDKRDYSITLTKPYLLFDIMNICRNFQILKNQVSNVKISNLIKYLAICCRNGKGITIMC